MEQIITEDKETLAEQHEREAFEALTPNDQAHVLRFLLFLFDRTPSYVERFKQK